MDTITQAQIYLADQRGMSQTPTLRSSHTFNFGQYFHESRRAFGALHLLNDDVLTAGYGLRMAVESNTHVILIPVVGGLEFRSDVGNGFLEAGQAQIFSLRSGMTYEVINPYETETINYLVFWLSATSVDFSPTSQQTRFDLQHKNELLPFFTQNGQETYQGFIGRYDGRSEGIFTLTNPTNRVFVFVLQGVFEVQNRLLQERDGLALTDILDNVVDFEALSNEAIILLLEIPE